MKWAGGDKEYKCTPTRELRFTVDGISVKVTESFESEDPLTLVDNRLKEFTDCPATQGMMESLRKC